MYQYQLHEANNLN